MTMGLEMSMGKGCRLSGLKKALVSPQWSSISGVNFNLGVAPEIEAKSRSGERVLPGKCLACKHEDLISLPERQMSLRRQREEDPWCFLATQLVSSANSSITSSQLLKQWAALSQETGKTAPKKWPRKLSSDFTQRHTHTHTHMHAQACTHARSQRRSSHSTGKPEPVTPILPWGVSGLARVLEFVFFYLWGLWNNVEAANKHNVPAIFTSVSMWTVVLESCGAQTGWLSLPPQR